MERLTLDYYKEHISIVEFIKFRKNLEFVLVREGKVIKAFRHVKDKEGNPIKHNGKYSKKDKLIISQYTNPKTGVTKEVFFYREEDPQLTTPKSIIDFVQDFIFQGKPLDFRRITGVLKQYMDHPEFKHREQTEMFTVTAKEPKESSATKKAKLKLGQPTLETFDYLKSRGITRETYNHPIFIGTYGSHLDQKDTFNLIRPAFALIDEDNKLHTLQTIDFNGTHHRGKYLLSNISRDGALYQSNFIPKETNTIILVESPEKAMAHFQLYRNEMEQQKVRPFYLSSCGNFTQGDLSVVRRQLEYRGLKYLITAFDNDKAGFSYTLHTLLTLNFVNPDFKIKHEDSTQIHIEFNKNMKEFFTRKSIPFKEENNLLKTSISPSILFKKILPENINTHIPLSKDFLDDLATNSKLPFRFKNTFNNNQNLSL